MSIRVKNLLRLASIVEELEHDNNDLREKTCGFCMDYLKYHCGAPSCIAGWAAAQAMERKKLGSLKDETVTAAEWLGLDYKWACANVFFPVEQNWCDISPKRAAHVLRTIAKAGDDYKRLNMRSAWTGRVAQPRKK